MPVMDEFKEERAALKNGTPKEKLTYFWDYYKWYVVGGVIAVACIVSVIHNIVTHRDTALYAMLINTVPTSLSPDSDNAEAFAAFAGIDTEEYQVYYDTSAQLGLDATGDYQALQQIMVHISAADLDVMVSDADSLMRYAYQGNFHDLRTLLSPEQLEQYGDSLFYIDNAVLREVEEARQNNLLDNAPAYGDPRHPEDMREPVPVGVCLRADSPLLQDYVFREESLLPAFWSTPGTRKPPPALSSI